MIIGPNKIEVLNKDKGLTLACIESTLSPKPEKLRLYAIATVAPGGEVAYHSHYGESESYHILSGTAEYNDNGTITSVSTGDTTFTPSGQGHGIKNIGSEDLIFIALIIGD